MEDRGGKPARLRAALRSRAPGIRRISDPDVLPPDFRCPACVHSHFLLFPFLPLIFWFVAVISAHTHRLLAHDRFTDVCWVILQCYAVRFTAIEKGDCILTYKR